MGSLEIQLENGPVKTKQELLREKAMIETALKKMEAQEIKAEYIKRGNFMHWVNENRLFLITFLSKMGKSEVEIDRLLAKIDQYADVSFFASDDNFMDRCYEGGTGAPVWEKYEKV